MIINAKDKPISLASSNLPNMGLAVRRWFQKLKFGVIKKTQLNGYTQEVVTELDSFGVRVPFTPEQLKILKEGERSWNWSTLYCNVDLILNTDDRVIIKGVKYRVMGKTDYTEYGYLQYDVIEDYNEDPVGFS